MNDYFYAWLNQFENLGRTKARRIEEDLLTDPALGATRDQRLEGMKVARYISRAFAVAAFGTFLWGCYFPEPYGLCIAVLVGLPWLAILAMARSKGRLRLIVDWSDPRFSVGLAVCLPGYALAFRTTSDLNPLSWNRAHPLALAVAGLLLVLAINAQKRPREPFSSAIALAFCTGSYGYRAVLETNTLLDFSKPQVFAPEVLHLHFGAKSNTKYLVALPPWAPSHRKQKVRFPEIYSSNCGGMAPPVSNFGQELLESRGIWLRSVGRPTPLPFQPLCPKRPSAPSPLK